MLFIAWSGRPRPDVCAESQHSLLTGPLLRITICTPKKVARKVDFCAGVCASLGVPTRDGARCLVPVPVLPPSWLCVRMSVPMCVVSPPWCTDWFGLCTAHRHANCTYLYIHR